MSLHQLYRHFDQHGHLLYVGQSISALARLLSHKSSPWIADIAFVSIDRYESADVLNEAEAIAIATEAPIYNKVQPNPRAKEPEASGYNRPDGPKGAGHRGSSRLRAGRTAQDAAPSSDAGRVAIQASNRPKSSDGRASAQGRKLVPDPSIGKTRDSQENGAGVAPGPSEAKPKTGRPKITDPAKMSRSTRYRRKAEERGE